MTSSLHLLMEHWLGQKNNFVWCQSKRPLNNRLDSSLKHIFRGHLAAVTCVANSLNGKYIASGSKDQTVRIWEKDTHHSVFTFRKHHSAITSLCFSPDNKHIASADQEGHMHIWEAETGHLLATRSNSAISCICFHPDGSLIAIAYKEGVVQIWDINKKSVLRSYDLKEEIYDICYRQAGSHMVAVTKNGNIIWNLESLSQSKVSPLPVVSVSYDSSGKYLATAGVDKIIRIWDVAAKKVIKELKGHKFMVHQVQYMPQSHYLVSAGEDWNIRLWDGEKGECLQVLSGHERKVNSICSSVDGKEIISASGDHTVRIWDVNYLHREKRLLRHDRLITGFSVDPRGKFVATSSLDDCVRLWELESGLCHFVLKAKDHKIPQVKSLPGYERYLENISYSPDGQKIAAGLVNGKVCVWDTKGEQIHELIEHKSWVRTISYSPDGQYLTTGADDGSICIYDTYGTCLYHSKEHSWPVFSLSFSPDSKHFVSGSLDESVKVWEIATGKCLHTTQPHKDFVNNVCYSPCGTNFASCCRGAVCIWNAKDFSLVCVFEEQEDFYKLAYSPGGKFIVALSRAGKIYKWDLETAQCVETRLGLANVKSLAQYSIKAIYNNSEICLEKEGQNIAKFPAVVDEIAFVNETTLVGYMGNYLYILETVGIANNKTQETMTAKITGNIASKKTAKPRAKAPHKLYNCERHENLLEEKWQESKVKEFIKEFVAKVETQFDEHKFWPIHPRDNEFKVSDGTIKGLYAGASGVIWSLEMLAQKGLVDLTREYHPFLEKVYKKYLEDPDTGSIVPSFFVGEVGILTAAYKFQQRQIWADQLYKVILENAQNPANELLFGSPGTMLGAVRMHEWSKEERWQKLIVENIEYLFGQWQWDTKYQCWLWKQNLYGHCLQFLGAGHGFIGNVYALLQAELFLSSEQKEQLVQRCIEVVKKFIVVEDICANFPTAPDDQGQMIVQWCHGAPGLITSLAKFPSQELDHILTQAGELVWQSGPLTKGCSLCHGTDGNGYAFLALYQRTRDKKWLDRARYFAMYAIKQVQKSWQTDKMRFSLWTGDIGLAMFLCHCLEQEYSLPVLDKI